MALISPNYNEDRLGNRIGRYTQSGSYVFECILNTYKSSGLCLFRCKTTFSVPASKAISVFIAFQDIPDSNSCKNSKLKITSSASTASTRTKTTCNSDDNGKFISIASESSAYTLTVEFTPSANENNGLGFVLLLSACKLLKFSIFDLIFDLKF